MLLHKTGIRLCIQMNSTQLLEDHDVSPSLLGNHHVMNFKRPTTRKISQIYRMH